MATKSQYKTRKAERLHGRTMEQRENMPWFYTMVMKDFGLREMEQAEAARRAPLSTDPNVPWGNVRARRAAAEEERQFEAMEQAK